MNKSTKVFECPKCQYVGLYDEYWQGGIHSKNCVGRTVFIGWLSKSKPSIISSLGNKNMTKTEIEIISLLKIHSAKRVGYGSMYTIGEKRVRETTLRRMVKKGLLEIGIHPLNLGCTGFVVASATE